MLQVQAEIVERRFLGASQELRLYAPALAGVLNPGQPVLVRAAWGRDPYLRRPYYPIGIDGESWLLRLAPAGDWGHAWLSAAPIGATVDCLGPVGIGYALSPGIRNLLCLGEEGASWSLLPLIEQAAAAPGLGGRPAGMAVTVAVEGMRARDLLPANRLPPLVEYHLATLDGSQGHHGRLEALLADWLAWADVVCAAGSLPFYERLWSAAHTVRYRLERGFVQVLYQAPILCGVGACQSCRVDLATGRRRACLRGPVFDLVDVRHGG
jgi:dihydroorotate dehydrogenase electron transfer subunit